MKEVKHYICDICHTEYNDKKKCTDCENVLFAWKKMPNNTEKSI